MNALVCVALGPDFIAECPPLPVAPATWQLTIRAREADLERLAWTRQRWGRDYWERAFVEIEGHPRFLANELQIVEHGDVLATPGFWLNVEGLADLRAGALLGVGIDHPRQPVGVALRSADRQRLWQSGLGP